MSLVQTRPELRHTETSKERERLDRLVQRGHRALRDGKPLSEVFTIDELDILRRRYSHFKDERDKEGYLVSNSHLVTKVSTPRPFLHLISSNHSREFGTCGSFWDGSGAGFSCLETVRIASERNGIAAELLVYVPVNHPLEVTLGI